MHPLCDSAHQSQADITQNYKHSLVIIMSIILSHTLKQRAHTHTHTHTHTHSPTLTHTHTAPSKRIHSETNILKESRIKKLKRRLSEGFLRLSVSPSPKDPSPSPREISPTTAGSVERPPASKRRTQRPKSLVSTLYSVFTVATLIELCSRHNF